MILNLLKRFVKATLHSAVEEWLAETGASKEMIDEVRSRREILAAQAVENADSLAARRLDVDDDREDPTDLPALPMPADKSEFDLMVWAHQQRQANVGWAEIAEAAGLTSPSSAAAALFPGVLRQSQEAPGPGESQGGRSRWGPLLATPKAG